MRKQGNCVRFPTSDIDFPTDILIRVGHLCFCLFHQVNQFFYTLTKQPPVLRERDFFASTNKQFFPSLSSKSFSCRERGSCVICRASAALVMLSSLTTVRKYCKTRISKGRPPCCFRTSIITKNRIPCIIE